MPTSDMVLHEEDFQAIRDLILKLRNEANARIVCLVDRNGQQIASVGDVQGLDVTALASLAAGNVAATDSLARLIGEKDFSTLYHEGEKDNLHLSMVGGRVILVVIFDERSSLGLVRLRVKKYVPELGAALEKMQLRSSKARSGKTAAASPFTDITDEDIDSLFGN
ncbi:MAG TPA: roadblock/LC7 domain-containing protein [Candidatus Polarisedimenticolia bacterium]|nr:roadblock/LC7 domain-containing protein [Candidatus Polarisedimenticolia bacterium]